MAKLQKSVLTFHVRGLAPGAVAADRQEVAQGNQGPRPGRTTLQTEEGEEEFKLVTLRAEHRPHRRDQQRPDCLRDHQGGPQARRRGRTLTSGRRGRGGSINETYLDLRVRQAEKPRDPADLRQQPVPDCGRAGRRFFVEALTWPRNRELSRHGSDGQGMGLVSDRDHSGCRRTRTSTTRQTTTSPSRSRPCWMRNARSAVCRSGTRSPPTATIAFKLKTISCYACAHKEEQRARSTRIKSPGNRRWFMRFPRTATRNCPHAGDYFEREAKAHMAEHERELKRRAKFKPRQ